MPPDQDTIAAIATPGGEGGIGVIRTSGQGALDAITNNVTLEPQTLTPREATLTKFKKTDDDSHLDEGLITYFPAPNSYTGEDVVELNCHGSPILLQTLLEDIIDQKNVRLAEPGEFTRRAFENDKMDLAQADAVASLISARSQAALRSSARQLEGELSDTMEDLRDTLVFCRSRIEAGLDFSDQDSVGDIPFDEIASRLETVETKIEEFIEEGQRGELLEQGCRTAIVGRPNVGKSSLMNQLLKTDRSIVTAQPGTTRDVISDQITVDGIPFRLFDTAGIHESPDEIEEEGVRRSKEILEDADLILFLVDASEPLKESDRSIYQMIEPYSTLVIENKMDLERSLDTERLNELIDGTPDGQISAKTGDGIDTLKDSLRQAVLGESVSIEDPLVTRTRHRQALQDALQHIERGQAGIEAKRDPTLIAQDLQEAGNELGRITGAITTDDLLDTIFSSFCIGK
jgi:tRNA modification GTPase